MKGTLQYATVVVMLTATFAGAADLNLVLVPPHPPVQSGATVILDLYLYNNTPDTVVHELPASLPCRIDTALSSVTVEADLVDGQSQSRVEIPGHGFAKRQYAVTLPSYALGSIQLQLDALDTNPVTIPVEKAAPGVWSGQQVSLEEGPTLVQSYLENFSVYEPMYFLLGVNPGLERSKYQFSFRYRLFNPKGFIAEMTPWVTGFHFGYTQRSLWDLKSDSKPFDDTSYLPELFYFFPKIDLNDSRISAFGIQAGFQHESNGRDGDDSRSSNYLYVKPIMALHLAGSFHLRIAPRFYMYLNNSDSTNSDLWAYRGYVDLNVGVVSPEGLAFDSHVWCARKGTTVQLDCTYPMSLLLGKNLNLYLQAQYFSGYAETLLRYYERDSAFRLGIAIVR